MLYGTAEHVHLAICGRDLVFLDAARGDYSLVAGAGEGVRPVGPAFAVDDPDLAGRLVLAGLMAPGRASASVLPAAPLYSALDQDPLRGVEGSASSLVDPGLVISATADALFGYSRRSFGTLLEEARRARRRLPHDERCDPRLLALASAFDAASPWLGCPGACLMRSLVLLRRLRRRGYAPLWVFGVRTWPFAAHCWLQAGQAALTDHADTLSVYTPILAV